MKHLKLFEETDLNFHGKFIAVLEQDHGCDYTIACGVKVIDLESENLSDAHNELTSKIEEEYTGDSKLSRATIYEVKGEHSINLKEIYNNITTKKQLASKERANKHDREEFERLSKKFKENL
jgi:hypothetical protein